MTKFNDENRDLFEHELTDDELLALADDLQTKVNELKEFAEIGANWKVNIQYRMYREMLQKISNMIYERTGVPF